MNCELYSYNGAKKYDFEQFSSHLTAAVAVAATASVALLIWSADTEMLSVAAQSSRLSCV